MIGICYTVKYAHHENNFAGHLKKKIRKNTFRILVGIIIS